MAKLKNIGGRYLTAHKQTGKIYNRRPKNNINKTTYKESSLNPSNPAAGE